MFSAPVRAHNLRISLKQLLVAFISCSVLMGLFVSDPQLSGLAIGAVLTVLAAYSAYWWTREPPLRRHHWKAPLLIGCMVWGCGAVVVGLATVADRWHTGSHGNAHFATFFLACIIFVAGAVPALVEAPLQAWHDPNNPPDRSAMWMRRLMLAAMVFGPGFFALAVFAWYSEVIVVIVTPFFDLGGLAGLVALYFLVLVAIVVQVLALVCFLTALLIRWKSGHLLRDIPWITGINLMYILAWAAYGAIAPFFW